MNFLPVELYPMSNRKSLMYWLAKWTNRPLPVNKNQLKPVLYRGYSGQYALVYAPIAVLGCRGNRRKKGYFHGF